VSSAIFSTHRSRCLLVLKGTAEADNVEDFITNRSETIMALSPSGLIRYEIHT
jgi:hypothetical protein